MDATEKTCTKCGETKPVGEFYRHKAGKFGVESWCKPCRNAHSKGWYGANSESVNDRAKEWAKANPEKVREAQKAYYDANPERMRAKRASYLEENRQSMLEATKQWYAENPEKARAIWAKKGARRRSTAAGRLNLSIRTGVHRGLRRGAKAGRSTFDVVGYTLEELRVRLESQFTPGMSWDNYGKGGWHVDHVRPLASFSYETPDDPEFRQAWALSNLQPLWEPENCSKGARLDHPSTVAALAANDNRPLKVAA